MRRIIINLEDSVVGTYVFITPALRLVYTAGCQLCTGRSLAEKTRVQRRVDSRQPATYVSGI